jgi:hypothetical protein
MFNNHYSIHLLAWQYRVGHMNNGESAAMWKAYAFNSGGIAIQSEIGALELAGDYSKVEVVQGKVN